MDCLFICDGSSAMGSVRLSRPSSKLESLSDSYFKERNTTKKKKLFIKMINEAKRTCYITNKKFSELKRFSLRGISLCGNGEVQ